jgi:hypothetical protein
MNKVEERRQKMMGLVEEWQKSGQTQKALAATEKFKIQDYVNAALCF